MNDKDLAELYTQVAKRLADEEALLDWQLPDQRFWRPWRVPRPRQAAPEGCAWRERLAWHVERWYGAVLGEVSYQMRVARWWMTVRLS